MTGGSEVSEAQELSKETPEVAEAKIQLDRATIEPEEAIEEGDIQAAEKVQEEFTALVDAVPLAEIEPPSVTESVQPAAEGNPTAVSDLADPADQQTRETEIIEALAESDLATSETIAEAARDQVQAAQELLREIAQRQSEAADNVTRPSAPPEGSAAAGDSEGMSVTANGEEISVSPEAKDNAYAADVAYVPPTQTSDVQDYESSTLSSAEGVAEKGETAQKVPVTESPEGTSADQSDAEPDTIGSSEGSGDPVSGVTGVSAPRSDGQDFDAAMEGAQSGELNGFENPNDDPIFAFRTDDSTTPQELADQVFDEESHDLENEEIAQAAEQIGEHNTTDGDSGSDQTPASSSRPSADVLEKMEIGETVGGESESSEEMSEGSNKVLGSALPSGMGGLDLDDGDPSDGGYVEEKPVESPDIMIDSSEEISATGIAADELTNFSGTDLRSMEDLIKEWEEKLNDHGEDAELADIDMQGMLEKQQETINMMSNISEILHDTAEIVIRKMALGQTSAGDTPESEDNNEGGENIIVIPAENSQIDFAGTLREATKIEPLPGRTASGDHLETPGDAANLDVTRQEDPPAYDSNLKPEEVGENQQEGDDRKASTREEIITLQDELSDWPEGETREITVTTWEEGEDGTLVKVEKTITLTKEEAEELLEEMGSETEGTEGRGLYNLEEGSLLVGEALGAELAPDADEFLEGMMIDRQEETSETSSQDEGTSGIEEMHEQARMLDAEIRRLQTIFGPSNSEEIKEITYNTVEKTGEHSYETVSVTTSVTVDELKEIILALNRLKMDILMDIKGMNSIYDHGPGEYTDDSTQPGDNSTVVEISYTSNQTLGDTNQSSDNPGSLDGKDDDSLN